MYWAVQIQNKNTSDNDYITICRGYELQNYYLTAILTNIPIGSGLEYVSKPRGLPENLGLHSITDDNIEITRDISLIIDSNNFYEVETSCFDSDDTFCKYIFLGNNVFTWYNLSELLDFNWDKEIQENGIVKTYRELVGSLFFDFLDEMKEYCDKNDYSYDKMRFVIGVIEGF